MLPSVDNRINNIIKSLSQTINPAIDPKNGMAVEQSALVIGHLNMLLQQWDKNHIFEAGNYDNYVLLAQSLIATVSESELLSPVINDVQTILDTQQVTTDMPVSEMTQCIIKLGKAVDALMIACEMQGTSELNQNLHLMVLKYAKHQAWRERVWFQSHGMDPEASELCGIDEMLKTPLSL